jgi:hypothetical protein
MSGLSQIQSVLKRTSGVATKLRQTLPENGWKSVTTGQQKIRVEVRSLVQSPGSTSRPGTMASMLNRWHNHVLKAKGRMTTTSRTKSLTLERIEYFISSEKNAKMGDVSD